MFISILACIKWSDQQDSGTPLDISDLRYLRHKLLVTEIFFASTQSIYIYKNKKV